MPETIFIDRLFNGPPTSGNGGYVAGMVAKSLRARLPRADAVEVTLRAALTLDRPLQMVDTAEGGVALMDGEQLLATAQGVSLDLELPIPPTLEQARAAGALGRLRSAGRTGNPYLHCFGCGIARTPETGLRIVPAEFDDSAMVASDWIPDPHFADDGGKIPAEIVWTALDCPAGFAWGRRLGGENTALLTGRITLAIVGEVRAGEPYVVLAWPLERDGRKLHAGTALFDAQGRALAYSRQLWFAPKA